MAAPKKRKYTEKPESQIPKITFRLQYTSKQKNILNFLRTNKISCITGDPGTSKTWSSIYYALLLLSEGAVDTIVISKPLIEVGKSMGYLPGSEDEKYTPYLDSYITTFNKIIGEDATRNLINGKKIVFEPVNFIRGVTYEHSIVIFDEVQNASLHEIITFITRCSDNTPIILLGDVWQSDIKNSGFQTFIDNFPGLQGIDHMYLDETYQMRSKLITDIYKTYKELLSRAG